MDGMEARLPVAARPPWFEFFGWSVYQPRALFWWWFAYDAYARPIFVEGAYIAASGGIGRHRRGRRGYHHVGVARAGDQEGHDLRLSVLGQNPGDLPRRLPAIV
jgi:hypothetical protein